MNWESICDKITSPFFGLICHQNPTELLYIDGKAVTLCPRCMGLQFGFLCAFTLVTALEKRSRWNSVGSPALVVMIFFALLAPFHWALCRVGIIVPSSAMRLASGLGSGAALAVLLDAYLARKSGRISGDRLKMSIVPALAVVAVAELAGSTLASLTSWLMVTLIMFTCVLGNSLIAVHTLSAIALGMLNPKSKTISNGG